MLNALSKRANVAAHLTRAEDARYHRVWVIEFATEGADHFGTMALFNDRSVLPTFRAAPDPDRSASSPYDDLNRLPHHAPATEHPAPVSARAESPSRSSKNDGKPHPLIEGLFDKLPEPEMEWSLFARQKWLQTAASIFDLMYASSETEGGELSIRVERSSGRDSMFPAAVR